MQMQFPSLWQRPDGRCEWREVQIPGQQRRRWRKRQRKRQTPLRRCPHRHCCQLEPLPSFKLVSSSVDDPTQSCSSSTITDAINFLYHKLFDDTVSKIKSTLKPSFCCPYLHIKVQSSVSVRGQYDTGASISCLSQKVFCQIPPQHHPTKLEGGGGMPIFKSAGGQILQVQGKYQFEMHIGSKSLQRELYVIPDLNELLILGIDLIQLHQLWYCPKNCSFAWEGQPNWGSGHLKVCRATIIPPLSVAYVKVAVRTEGGAPPDKGNLCLANVASSQHPLVTGGPYLVSPDTLGKVTLLLLT